MTTSRLSSSSSHPIPTSTHTKSSFEISFSSSSAGGGGGGGLEQSREAVDAFRRAVDTSPTYFEAYASLGGALTPMRKWKEASNILTHALLLQPSSPEVSIHS
jgi:hypothetical protein